jgi:DNA adenine methylase/adenine-specific DNA-methyltransferase
MGRKSRSDGQGAFWSDLQTEEMPAKFEVSDTMPTRTDSYPQLRYMGNKYRLLPWIYDTLRKLEFKTALDAFSGSGCVAYLLKAMGKAVTTNDFLRFAHALSESTTANSTSRLTPAMRDALMEERPGHPSFIEDTFAGIFYTAPDLRFLDVVWSNLDRLPTQTHRSVALAALVRSCIKRQPRGVFTVSDPDKYMDGRRDLRISLREHFIESVEIYNSVVFDNGHKNRAFCGDIFQLEPRDFDLVYMDPPYVPRADDNCYVKRS